MNLAKQTFIALTVLALAGCASVGELRDRTPYVTLDSHKPAADVAECIRDGWQNQRLGIEANGAALQTTSGTFTVVSPSSGIPSEIADVKPSNGLTTITMYTQAQMDMGGRKAARASVIRGCI